MNINYWINKGFATGETNFSEGNKCYILTSNAPHLTMLFDGFQDLAFPTEQKVWEFITAQRQFYKDCKHTIIWEAEDE
mgnify:CR=1 FL=1